MSKAHELTVCGWNACRRVFEKRPDAIRRLFFGKERSPALGEVKKWLAAHKRPYRELDTESLNKAAAGIHHEGIVMVVDPLPCPNIQQALGNPAFTRAGTLVALDRIGNAHNLGAILRNAAYFGAIGLLAAAAEGQAAITPAVARTAEGALEVVPTYQCTDLPSALRDLKQCGAFILGADAAAKNSLYDVKPGPFRVLVLGNEREGLSVPVRRRCDALARIPGCGMMESLNVAVASGIMLAELARGRRRAT